MAVLFGFTYLKLTEIHELIASLSDQQMAGELSQRIMLISTIMFLSVFTFTAMVSAYLMVVAHRVGGPVVAISRYVREIREGKYDLDRALRDGDELGPIMDELKELARTLKTREKA